MDVACHVRMESGPEVRELIILVNESIADDNIAVARYIRQRLGNYDPGTEIMSRRLPNVICSRGIESVDMFELKSESGTWFTQR